jgi:hypothetical protein
VKPDQRSDLRILEGGAPEGSFPTAATLAARAQDAQWRRVWLAVAVAAVTAGLLWRLAGTAAFGTEYGAPQLFHLLNGLAVALWLAGWLAAGVLQRAVQSAGLNVIWPVQPVSAYGAQLVPHIGWLLATGSAAAGVAVAFSPSTVLLYAMTADPAEFNVYLWAVLGAAIFTAGPPLLALSTALLALLRAILGTRAGVLAWLLCGVFMNAKLLGGAAGAGLLKWTPPLLGQVILQTLAQFSSDERNYTYLREMLFTALRWPLLLALLAAGFALLAVQRINVARGQRPLQLPANFALLAGAGVALLRCAVQNWHYVIDPGLRHPGHWLDIFCCGFIATMLFQWLIESTTAGELPGGLRLTEALQVATVSVLFAVLSLPNVSSGQIDHDQLWAATAVCLLLLLAGSGLLRRLAGAGGVARGSTSAWVLSAVCVALLCTPMDGRLASLPMLVLDQLSAALTGGGVTGGSWSMLLVLAVLALCAAVPWRRLLLRMRRRTTAAIAQAV